MSSVDFCRLHFCTITVTSVESERSSSWLKLINAQLRPTITKDWSGLAVLSIHSEGVNELHLDKVNDLQFNAHILHSINSKRLAVNTLIVQLVWSVQFSVRHNCIIICTCMYICACVSVCQCVCVCVWVCVCIYRCRCRCVFYGIYETTVLLVFLTTAHLLITVQHVRTLMQ